MTNFDEYIRQGEPNEREKGLIWQTAIGLQQVDGLTPSAYLIDVARQNIEGDITFEEVKIASTAITKPHLSARKTTEQKRQIKFRRVLPRYFPRRHFRSRR